MSAGDFRCVRPRQWWTWVVAWTVLLVLAMGAAPAFAQSASFFSQVDELGDVEAGGHCLRTFSSELLAAGLVERPSAEIETLMRECVEDLSNPGFVRECDLSLARGQVNYVFRVGAQQDGADWLFYIQALSPIMAGAVWQRDELTTASSALRAARDGCAYLAADFLYRQEFVSTPPTRGNSNAGVSESGGGGVLPPPPSNPAVVHVVGVTPSPATFYVNGQEVGLAPGQVEVPAGVATSVELRSPGYAPWTRTVTVEAGEVERVSNVTLVALPATLELTANVQGGEILVDGSVVGSTLLNRAVTVSVPSGDLQVSVRLDGYDEYRTQLTLAPGSTHSLTATLSVPQSGPAQAPPGFVYIQPGTFLMGSPNTEEGRYGDDTQHEVTLTRGFYIQTTEVTQGQWQALMGSNPSRFTGCGLDCPVEQVSWEEAVAYANALSEAEGLTPCYDANGSVGGADDIYNCRGYRLPTEAEWEYAARAGSQEATYAGEMRIVGLRNAPVLTAIAVYGGNSLVTYPGGRDCSDWRERADAGGSTCGPHQVGTLAPNAWGLFDMLGNVYEWTNDYYGRYPARAIDPTGDSEGSERVYRGGGWNELAHGVRAATRQARSPQNRYDSLGFRLARTAQ